MRAMQDALLGAPRCVSCGAVDHARLGTEQSGRTPLLACATTCANASIVPGLCGIATFPLVSLE